MNERSTVLGVVVQLHQTSHIRGHAAALPGLATGTLELLGDATDNVGVSISFDSITTARRFQAQVRQVIDEMTAIAAADQDVPLHHFDGLRVVSGIGCPA